MRLGPEVCMVPYTRTWVWPLSGLLIAGAVLLSLGLGGQFTLPQSQHPNGVRRLPTGDAGRLWQALPSYAPDGWLPESRWSSRPFFDVTARSVDVAQILDMPPGVDDIPAITRPNFLAAWSADWLADDDEVLALALGPQARCYPLAVLRWHGVVNDVVAGHPVAVVFDPLSGAAMGLSRSVGPPEPAVLTLGVSGKAYNGCALLYDREGRNLWYPIRGECIAGPRTQRNRLRLVWVERTTWAAWRAQYPWGQVLSRDTGFGRPYDMDPYAQVPVAPGAQPVNYWTDPTLILAPPVYPLPAWGVPPKTVVLGVCHGDYALAIVPPRNAADPIRFHTLVGDMPLTGIYDPRPGSAAFRVADLGGKRPPQLTCFWFAWQAAYPATRWMLLPGRGASHGQP